MPKPRVPSHLRRQLLFGRVLPRTLAYLESLGQPNMGRAIDYLVESHKSIIKVVNPRVHEELSERLPAKLPIDTA